MSTGQVARGNGRGWGGGALPGGEAAEARWLRQMAPAPADLKEEIPELCTLRGRSWLYKVMLTACRSSFGLRPLPADIKDVISGHAGTCPFFASRQFTRHQTREESPRGAGRVQLPDHLDPIV